MLVREIIDRVRNDLDDNRTVEYTDVDLLDRIRMELNDRAEAGTPIDVLNEVRKILGDDGIRTGVPVSLASIRGELNDTADVTAISAANLLAYLRDLLGDESSRTGTAVSLTSIRAELNDTADVTAATQEDITKVSNSILAKMGKASDSQIGTTTEANVSVDSVIHYAQWGNIGNVTGTNGNVNSSVVIANSSNLLSMYAADGIKTIKGMRPDGLVGDKLNGGFQAALNLYVLARCLEGEVETNSGNGGYRTFHEQFEKAVAAVPAYVQDAAIANFISLGTVTITARRPDLGAAICKSTLSLLENFAMAQAAQTKQGGELQANLATFYSDLDKIPYHYVDAELNQFIADGQNAVKSLRPDAASDINLFSEAVKSYVICHAMGRRFGKSAEAMSLWQAHDANFKSVVAAVPYHWTDAELNNFITIVSTDIRGRRPDLGVCNGVLSLLLNFAAAHARQQKPGNTVNLSVEEEHFYAELDKIPYHYADAELNQYIADGQNAIKAIRQDAGGMIDCFSDAVKSYAVCHALGRRFGKAAETMSLWQAHDANFKTSTAAVPYHWTDAELTALSETGGSVIAVKRPDLSGTGAESVGRLHYTVFSALERRIGSDSNAAVLHKVHYDQFYTDLETVPYHWSDEELTKFQDEAIQTISSLRDDMTDGMKIRSDLVPAVLFCVSSLANNIRKDAASRNLSDAQWTKLVSLTKGLPYHWTDGELLNQVHDSIRDILTKRSDARMDELGYELNGIETEPLIGDEYPLRESFAKASEWFSAAGAISSRIGTDAGADGKYQVWMGRYNEQIMGSTNRRS